jgi:histidinol dehydrogenase
MNTRKIDWENPVKTAQTIRRWFAATKPGDAFDAVEQIRSEIEEERDVALRRLTERFDRVKQMPESLRVDPNEAKKALAALEPELRDALEVAAANIQAVASTLVSDKKQEMKLPQGQTVTIREVPVARAGIYAPGGRATYPSSVLMCAIPARAAGVEGVALASPPGPDGHLAGPVLAAAALCGIDEIYAMGGAQAIFALTYGTETVSPVNVIAGPGNVWVQEAKRMALGLVGIDSYAGPSELMVIAGHDTNPEWVALDLCSQAEHGPEGALVAVAVEENVLDAIAVAAEQTAELAGLGDASLALVQVSDLNDAIELANAFAPEHLQLMEEDAALLADRVTTAGCVFAGRYGATAFGDYVAGSNHVLPTSATGRFWGPLGPSTFRRKISTVEVSAEAAAKLAPHVDVLARAEGFPLHGESAMIRAEK